MSVIKENKNKPLKVTVVVLGIFLITAGITPYIKSYLLSHENNKSTKIALPTLASSNASEALATQSRSSQEVIVDKSDNDVTSNAQPTDKETEVSEVKQEKDPLPALYDSDAFFLKNLQQADTQSLFVTQDIIRNMVVFVDNFSKGELVHNFSPLVKPDLPFSVTKQKGILIVNSDSYLRYDKYAQVISKIDTDTFINLYLLLSPLIDEAYQEIGYPPGSFNETFDKAIDHLLATPIIQYKLEVNSPSVMYQYTDKNLESLPDSQKQMLRMGPDNLLMVKEKLQEIQNELQRL